MTTYEITPPPTRLADRVQVRLGFSKNQGTVTRFMVQLEYWLEDDWCAVVRYDHDQEAPGGHNITEEGLHRDVYREGEKIGTVQVTNPIPANEGFNYTEDDLRENVKRYIKRFGQWHDIRDGADL